MELNVVSRNGYSYVQYGGDRIPVLIFSSRAPYVRRAGRSLIRGRSGTLRPGVEKPKKAAMPAVTWLQPSGGSCRQAEGGKSSKFRVQGSGKAERFGFKVSGLKSKISKLRYAFSSKTCYQQQKLR